MSTRPVGHFLALAFALSWATAAWAGDRAAADGIAEPGSGHDRPLAPDDASESVLTAANPGPHDPALLLALSDFHRDAYPAEIAAFGPGVVEQLVAVANDPDVLRLARVRALAALGDLGDELAWATVTAIARDADADPRVRMGALFTIGHRFEAREGKESVLAEALREPDAGLRRYAVEALAAVGTDEAMAILDGHRIAERDVSVRVVLRELREMEAGQSGSLPREGVAPRTSRSSATHGEVLR
jgi:hypothetical protein